MASKWIEEISENCAGVKLVLTALKCDLRKDEFLNDNPNAITYEEGLAKAKEIGAVKYLGKDDSCPRDVIRVMIPDNPGRVLRRAKSWYHGNILRSCKGRPGSQNSGLEWIRRTVCHSVDMPLAILYDLSTIALLCSYTLLPACSSAIELDHLL